MNDTTRPSPSVFLWELVEELVGILPVPGTCYT